MLDAAPLLPVAFSLTPGVVQTVASPTGDSSLTPVVIQTDSSQTTDSTQTPVVAQTDPSQTPDPSLAPVVAQTDSSPTLDTSTTSGDTSDLASGSIDTQSIDTTGDVTAQAGTWTLATAGPVAMGTMMLLSNGDVMAQGGVGNSNDTTSATWFQLAPSPTGGYTTGTWSSLASMSTARLFFASNVLPTGKVFVQGGEYSGSNVNNWINTGEIYDPVANTWSTITTFPQSQFGDDPSEVLSNGTVLAGYLSGPQTYIYNPTANTWTLAATKLRNDRSDEETWVKLPDGSILSYDVFASPATGAGSAQRYVPSTNTWVDAGSVPVPLSGASVGDELGPGLLLPDGRVFQIGGNGNTALYTPSTNTWATGPVIPNAKVADDAPAVELTNGHVLFAADTYFGVGPTQLFDFDPVANTITQVTGLPAQLTTDLNGGAFTGRFLALPTGQAMFVSGTSTDVWIYTSSGGPSASSQPTIYSIAANGDGSYTLTGTQINGISEGASFGDDAEMSSNYPIVQLTSTTTGNVSYARTFNWSSTGVATGSTPTTTEFTLPAGIAAGNYSLTVVANGIASPPISATLGTQNLFHVPILVTSSSPTAGSLLFSTPTSYVFTFNEPVDPATLSASDLQVNSMPATGVTLSSDGLTATFTFSTNPVVNFGLQTMSIAANSFFVLGDPLSGNLAFNATFRTDDFLLQVTTTNPPPITGAFTLPTFTYDVTFNKPVDPTSVTTSSLVLSGIAGATVTGATVLPGNTTARFTISASTAGILNISIPVGAINDLYGNPGAAFSASYFVDLISPSAFPTPLSPTAPPGSLIYSGSLVGAIGPVGHSDTLTLNIDPGQTITVLVTPTSSTLQPTLQLSDPSGSVLGSTTAPAAGADAVLQTVPTTTGGTYTMVVGGSAGTTGLYTVQVTLNAALESESVGGPNNATVPQDLSGSFASLGNGIDRGAVVGAVSAAGDSRDLYSVNLSAGTTATLALTSLTGGSVDLRLLSSIPSTTRIWTGASTTDSYWTTPANWLGNIAPAAGDDLVFPAGAAKLSPDDTFPNGTDFHSITFTGNGYDLFGNSITLDAGITTTNATNFNEMSNSLVFNTSQTILCTYATSQFFLFSGTITINGQALTVDGSGATFLEGAIGGSGGLIKNGPATLSISATNTYAGLTTLNAGITQISTAAALGATTAGTVVNAGATLQVTGAVTVAEPLTLNGSGVNNNPLVAAGALTASATSTWSGTIMLGSNAAIGAAGVTLTINGSGNLHDNVLTINSTGTVNLNGVIGVGGGTGSLVVNATLTTGTVSLGTADGFTGTTTIDAGVLTLSGNGTSASPSYTVNQGATLRLDNTGTNNLNRLTDTAAITLNGGTLSDLGSSTANSSETVGVITLGRGYSTITTTPGGSEMLVLAASSLARNATATVNFNGTNVGTATNQVTFASAPTLVGNNGGILPYATVSASASVADFATVGSNGIVAYSGYKTTLTGLNPGDVVKLSGSQTVSTTTPMLAGLVLNGVGTLTLSAGVTLHSGALVTTGTLATTISDGAAAVVDLAGPSLAEGIVQTDNPSLTLGTLLGTDSLGASGTGTLFMTTTGQNYNGGTTLNSGTLTVVSGGLGSGTLNLVGGTLTPNAAATLTNALALNNAVTTISGTSQIILSGAATLTGVNALNVSNTSNTTTVSGSLTGTGSLEKLGANTLILSPATTSTFSGGTVLQAGTLTIGTANMPWAVDVLHPVWRQLADHRERRRHPRQPGGLQRQFAHDRSALVRIAASDVHRPRQPARDHHAGSGGYSGLTTFAGAVSGTVR